MLEPSVIRIPGHANSANPMFSRYVSTSVSDCLSTKRCNEVLTDGCPMLPIIRVDFEGVVEHPVHPGAHLFPVVTSRARRRSVLNVMAGGGRET